MKFPRRRFLQLTTGAVVLPAASRIARAQTYPSRPIRLVVPFAPGGATDVAGRLWADRIKPLIGTVIVENRASGGGVSKPSSLIQTMLLGREAAKR